MRMPFYLYHNPLSQPAHRPRVTVTSALAIGATLVLYVGLLAFVLLRGQS
jgi:hypothetical protein